MLSRWRLRRGAEITRDRNSTLRYKYVSLPLTFKQLAGVGKKKQTFCLSTSPSIPTTGALTTPGESLLDQQPAFKSVVIPHLPSMLLRARKADVATDGELYQLILEFEAASDGAGRAGRGNAGGI